MKIYKIVVRAFEFTLVVIVFLQALLLMASVIFRYCFDSPIVWGDEIVRYALIWTTFIGAAMATKENLHIQVDVLDMVLPRIGQKITNIFVDLVVIGFMGVMIYFGIRMTDFQRGMFGETLNWFSYAYVYVSIPIGSSFMVFFTVAKYFVKEDYGLGRE